MMRIFCTVLLAIITINLFSISQHDKRIAEALIQSTNKITIEILDEVLEYDPENQYAIKEKVKLLYFKNEINKVITLIENVDNYDKEIWFIDLELNYRLGNHKEICSTANKYRENDSEKALFYIIDSFIRIGADSLALEILYEHLLVNPYSVLLNELNFLLTKDSGSLRILRESLEGYNSILRLYNRLNEEERGHSLLEKVIKYDSKNYEFDDIRKLIFNYKTIPFFRNYIDENVSGVFYFDKNSNTFIDTVFDINKGVLNRKSIDLNGDGLFENELFLNNGLPNRIIYYDNELFYKNYPYVDRIITKNKSITTLHFFNNKSIYRIEKLLDDIVIPVKNYDNNEDVDIKEIQYDNSYEKWEYRADNTIVKFIDEENNNIFSHIVLEIDNKPVSGVKDLDFDGVYDIHEKYLGGELIGSGFFIDGTYEYYESYDNFDIKIFNYDDDEIKFVLKDEDGNIYTMDLVNTESFDSIVKIKKDNYNWILKE